MPSAECRDRISVADPKPARAGSKRKKGGQSASPTRISGPSNHRRIELGPAGRSTNATIPKPTTVANIRATHTVEAVVASVTITIIIYIPNLSGMFNKIAIIAIRMVGNIT